MECEVSESFRGTADELSFPMARDWKEQDWSLSSVAVSLAGCSRVHHAPGCNLAAGLVFGICIAKSSS